MGSVSWQSSDSVRWPHAIAVGIEDGSTGPRHIAFIADQFHVSRVTIEDGITAEVTCDLNGRAIADVAAKCAGSSCHPAVLLEGDESSDATIRDCDNGGVVEISQQAAQTRPTHFALHNSGTTGTEMLALVNSSVVEYTSQAGTNGNREWRPLWRKAHTNGTAALGLDYDNQGERLFIFEHAEVKVLDLKDSSDMDRWSVPRFVAGAAAEDGSLYLLKEGRTPDLIMLRQ